jgi:hypothetical protein
LTVKKNAGGIVEAEGINCGNDCSQDYVSNTESYINCGFLKMDFVLKNGKENLVLVQRNSCKFKMDSNKEVTAIFEKKPEGVQGQAIIIAGGGAKPENTLFPYTHEFTERMYQILNERGFTDTDNSIFKPIGTRYDMDGYPDKERT